MRRIGSCVCVGIVISLLCVHSACAYSELDVILRLLVKKGVITEQEAAEARVDFEQEREAAKTELKVEVKEELADEGLPLPTGGKFKLYGEVAVVGYIQDNTYFTRTNSVSFVENVARLGVKGHLTERVDADIRVTAANTAGDDEQLFGTSSDDIQTDVDIANIQVKDVMGWPLAVTLGRQEIVMGDGFLIGDGRADTTAQWSIPLKSFDALRGTLDFNPLTVDVFMAYLDEDWTQYLGDGTDELPMTAYTSGGELFGANVHYDGERKGIWDFGVFFREDDSTLDNDTLALSLKGVYDVPFISGLTIDGEIVQELGSTQIQQGALSTDRKLNRQALGGHLDLTYTFENLRFTPYIAGSYIYLPGDNPDTPGRNEAFDPLFFDYTDWGRWYIGDIVGGAGQIINSNERVTKVEVGCTPTSSTQFRLQFFNIVLDRGLDNGSRINYANEFNAILDYWPNEIFYAGLAFGYAHPLEAAKYWNADADTGEEADEDTLEFLMWTGVEF